MPTKNKAIAEKLDRAIDGVELIWQLLRRDVDVDTIKGGLRYVLLGISNDLSEIRDEIKGGS